MKTSSNPHHTQGGIPRTVATLCLLATTAAFAATETNTPAVAPTNAPSPAPTATSTTNKTAKTALSAAGIDLNVLKDINRHNIFNPSREPSDPEQEPGGVTKERIKRVEYFDLTGTMSYDGKGPFAFFSSSDAKYSMVLKAQDTIAGYKVVEIKPDGVKLETGGKQFELKVDMQMRREELGPWFITNRNDYALVTYDVRASGMDFNPRQQRFGGDQAGRRGGSPLDFMSGDQGGRRGGRTRGGNGGGRPELTSEATTTPAAPARELTEAEKAEAIKKMMENREKETQ